MVLDCDKVVQYTTEGGSRGPDRAENLTAFDAFDGFDKGPAAAAEFGRFDRRGSLFDSN